ncbi:hypothetical protein A2382_03440 [Candidatus Woesebacteria bacterium RIFOXYB1_FULL_38_16]|uniref:Uncharacterized protein n=1 Tax=Candidatus Woesebacteria bacterium RIFOXYB1_FULL_38_16 TaxID=1802538 RepID=A0A1F8CRJ6_9BACT|nr:MAG: hypothetical protein A2191_03725 [Candidatus Woesebacteria bacterium RIFOXYA1_FULL_38_9]OGM78920.1 MAG: hypothetical protein A2382_03440 [Candidatus Woesebacteria bacterium RIFOXYB1_FULL_38_16]
MEIRITYTPYGFANGADFHAYQFVTPDGSALMRVYDNKLTYFDVKIGIHDEPTTRLKQQVRDHLVKEGVKDGDYLIEIVEPE